MSGVRTFKLKNISRDGSERFEEIDEWIEYLVSEREEVHKKAFTKWLNSHLSKAYPPVRITNLINDLSDGNAWLSLFEVLLDRKIEKSRGHSHLHNLSNLQKTLDICKENQIKLDGINAKDISEGNSKTILGLLWNIIVHFQMKGALKTDSKAYSIEKILQTWCQHRFENYKDVNVADFSTSWRDGKAFNAILHSYRPDLFDFSQVMKQDTFSRLDHAFTMASLEWNVPRLLEPTDVDVEKPDKKMITMYLTCLFEQLEARDKKPETVTSSETTTTKSHQFVTTNTEAGLVEKSRNKTTSKAFFLSRKRVKSDKSSDPDEGESTDFPRVFIEEKRTIQVGSVSSDVSRSTKSSRSSSSSSTGEQTQVFLSPASSGKESQSEEIVTTTTTTELEAFPDLDLSEPRVKHKEMYRLSSISNEDQFELESPELKRRFLPTDTSSPLKTDSEATSTETTIQVDTSEKGDMEPWRKREGTSENTTVTTVKEGKPGESTTTITRTVYTMQGPATKTVTRTSREIREITDIDGSTRKETREGSHVDTSEDSREGERKVYTIQGPATETTRTSRVIREIAVGSTRKETREGSHVDTSEGSRVVTQMELSTTPEDKSSSEQTTYTTTIRETSMLEMPGDKATTTMTKSISTREGVRETDVEIDKTSMECDTAFEEAETSMFEKSMQRHNDLFEDNLYEVENAVKDLERRIKDADPDAVNFEVLIQGCTNLESKIQGVITRGRTMIADNQLVDGKEHNYISRMEVLEKRIKILISTAKKTHKDNVDNSKYYEVKLTDAESSVDSLKSRIKKPIYNIQDQRDLMKEREDTDIKVHAVASLGHTMFEDKLIHEKKQEEFQRRIITMERKMTVIMIWPLILKASDILDYSKYYEVQLTDVESSVDSLKSRIKKPIQNIQDQRGLMKEREDTKIKVYAVASLGHTMIEDKFFHENIQEEFQRRIITMEREMTVITLWPLILKDSDVDYSKYYEVKLADVESSVDSLKSRIKKPIQNIQDQRGLMKEREDTEIKVYAVASLGQTMIDDKFFHENKQKEFQRRIITIEREMKVITLWPLILKDSDVDYSKYYEVKLTDVESSLDSLKSRIKKPIQNIQDQRGLMKEREDTEVKVYAVASLGHTMIEDKFFHENKQEEFKRRIITMQREMTVITLWPLILKASHVDYSKYYEVKLTDVESSVDSLKSRIKKPIQNIQDQRGLMKEREDTKIKVYAVASLGHTMIEDKFFHENKQQGFQRRIITIEREMTVITLWPLILKDSHVDYSKYYEVKLTDVESSVDSLKSRIKKPNQNIQDQRGLMKEREDTEIKAYAVASLGHTMIENKFFHENKQKEFQRRIITIEREMKVITLWPLILKDSDVDYSKYYEVKLKDVESSVDSLKSRVKKPIQNIQDQRGLMKEREDTEIKVYAVASLGHTMIEDKFFNEKKGNEYQVRIEKLQHIMQLIMLQPLDQRMRAKEEFMVVEETGELSSIPEQDKDFDEELNKAENELSFLEPRVKKAIHYRDNKELIKELDNFNYNVHNVLSHGRKTIDEKLVDEDKAGDYQKRMDDLERKTRFVMGWPILDHTSLIMGIPLIEKASTRFSVHDRVRFLDHKLEEAENDVTSFERRLKHKNLSSDDAESLTRERKHLEPSVVGVIGLGRGMIEDKLVDKNRDEEYMKRFEYLEKSMNKVMIWPIIRTASDVDYGKYYEVKLTDVESSVDSLKSRIKKPIQNIQDQRDLLKEREDTEIKVYAVASLGHTMIEDKFFYEKKQEEFQRRIITIEREMAVITLWPLILKDSDVDYSKYYEVKLTDVESSVDSLKSRIKKPIQNIQDQRGLMKERQDTKIKVYAVESLGHTIIEDKFFHENKQEEFQRRIIAMEREMTVITLWPLILKDSHVDYSKYYQVKLADVESSVDSLKSRIKKPIQNIQDERGLMKEREDTEIKVYAVASLGHTMIEDKFFYEKKQEEFQRRIITIEREMAVITLWPLILKDSDVDYSKYYEVKLTDVESSVDSLKSRIKKPIQNIQDQRGFMKQREETEIKVYAVASLGHAMIEDKFFNEKKRNEYKVRIEKLQHIMKLIMLQPLDQQISAMEGFRVIEETGALSSTPEQDKDFDEELNKAENELSFLGPRVKQSIHNRDNKELIKERDSFNYNVHNVLCHGRKMIDEKLVDEDKAGDYQKRMDDLERKTRFVMGWPILEHTSLIMGLPLIEKASTSFSVHDRVRFLDHKLEEAENDVTRFERRLKHKNLSEGDAESLTRERKHLEPEVVGVIGLGRSMIKDNLVDKNREEEYMKRFEDLEKRMNQVMIWPIIERASDVDYSKYYEVKLTEVESSVDSLESRIKKPIQNIQDQRGLMKEREDIEIKVHAVVSLGHAMIKDKFFDEKKQEEYKRRIITMERKMTVIMIWPHILKDSDVDYTNYYEVKLTDVESSVDSLKSRIKKPIQNMKHQKALMKEREETEIKVYAVASLGHAMIEDNFFNEKKQNVYQGRIKKLQHIMKLIMQQPLDQRMRAKEEFMVIEETGALSSIPEQDKDFDEELNKAENELSLLEPRVKKAIHNRDNKALIQERDKLNQTAKDAISHGREMLDEQNIDKEQAAGYQRRLDDLEKRMRLLMGWPILEETSILMGLPIIEKASTRLNVHDRVRFLQNKLREAEKGIENMLTLLKTQRNLTKEDAERFSAERVELEANTLGVLGLGRAMIEDNLIDKNRHKENEKRFKELEKKLKELMLWPLIIKSSDVDYSKYYEVKLTDAESSVDFLKSRIKKPIQSVPDQRGLMKERDETEIKVYAVASLGNTMIEYKFFDEKEQEDFQRRIIAMEREMTVIMLWPLILKDSDVDYSKYYEVKLTDVESSVDSLKSRIKKPIYNIQDQRGLMKERDDTQIKVYAVASLGHAMIEDKFFDEEKQEEFQRRIITMEREMTVITLWPLILKNSSVDYNKYFEHKLTEVETDVGFLEPRIKTAVFNRPNQQALITKLAEVEVQVYAIASLGRGLMEDKLFNEYKENDFKHRIGRLERTMRLLLMWPIGKLNSINDRKNFLQENLKEIEKAVDDFESRAEQKDMTEETMKEMSEERDNLASKADDIISLGRDMVNSKLVNGSETQKYTTRLDELDKKVNTLKAWPNKVGFVSPSDKKKDFEEAIKDMESAVKVMEQLVKNAIHNKENKALIKDLDSLDQSVQDVISLGRGMVDGKLFDREKAVGYQKRMNDLERRMKLLMGWPILEHISPLIGIPILEQTGELLNIDDREKFLEEKLQQAEEVVSYLQSSIREKQPSNDELKTLTRERDYVEPKVFGVVGLGRGMIEDNLVDKKKEDGYQKRIDDLEEKMKLLMCWSFGNIYESHDMFFEERLRDVEDRLWGFEDRVGDEHLDDNEKKALVNERDSIESAVYGVVSVGRGMLEDERFSDDKDQEFIDRIDDLEKRMNMLIDWPDGPQHRKPLSKRCRDFDTKLRKTEITVSKFEQRAKVTDRESVDLQSAKKSVDNIKALTCERDQLELDVSEVLSEGRSMVEDEQDMDPQDRSFYTRRMNRLEERIRLLREWLQNEMLRLHNLYIILIKQHLERLLDWLVRAEVKMDLEDDIESNNDGVVKQLDEHMEFHKEVGLYSTVNMILEIDIDDPAIDKSLHQDVKTLSERWAAVWNWSEERKNRLLEVIDDWEAFREKEKDLYDWLVGKDEAIHMSDEIDISDEDQVEAHGAILKNLVQDIKCREAEINDFNEAGEQLIASAQYHHKTAKPIRDEVNDFKECWQTELDRAQQRGVQLQDARKKFSEMALLKSDVNNWLDDTEELIATYNQQRNDEEQQTFLNKIEIQFEERDTNIGRLGRINVLNKELSPAIEKDSAKEINHVVDIMNRRMQDASDKLDSFKDDQLPLTHEECCLMDYIKRSLWEPGHGSEIRLKK